MLTALHGKASERKLWLFACACCRLVWHLLPDLCHRLVEAVERYADNETGPSNLVALFDGYYHHQVALSAVAGGNQAADAVGQLGQQWRWRINASSGPDWYMSDRVARSAAEALAKSMPWHEARQLEGQLLHEIFGPLPFGPVTLDRAWLTWNDGTVRSIAEGIYQERAFGRLPILADALLDAGCDNEELIQHCRTEGPHVRGCWAVDLILGKA
jgi:hypothetical protein